MALGIIYCITAFARPRVMKVYKKIRCDIMEVRRQDRTLVSIYFGVELSFRRFFVARVFCFFLFYARRLHVFTMKNYFSLVMSCTRTLYFRTRRYRFFRAKADPCTQDTCLRSAGTSRRFCSRGICYRRKKFLSCFFW